MKNNSISIKGLAIVFALAASISLVNASVFSYSVALDGPSEFPVNASPGTGSGSVIYDNVAHTLQLQVSFSGLIATNTGTTASHIHAATLNPFSGTAGVATTTPSFAGFPLGVTSGTFANTLDLTLASSWNGSYVTANGGTFASAEASLASAMAAGKAYWNIHSASIPGGEIRGFLTAVPEPGSISLLGLGAVAFIARRSLSRKS